MIRHFASAARWFAAAILVLLGIAGVMLPVVPGFLFFALAIALLATESHQIRRWLRWSRLRFPRILRWMKIPRGPRPQRRRESPPPPPTSAG